MDFVRDRIADSLMEQQKILYIKYCLFNNEIAIVKSTIFQLKTININICFFLLFYNLNLKSILNQTH
jgi:hypothetical protein